MSSSSAARVSGAESPTALTIWSLVNCSGSWSSRIDSTASAARDRLLSAFANRAPDAGRTSHVIVPACSPASSSKLPRERS